MVRALPLRMNYSMNIAYLSVISPEPGYATDASHKRMIFFFLSCLCFSFTLFLPLSLSLFYSSSITENSTRNIMVKRDRVTELRNRLAETSIIRTIRLSYRATYIFTKPPCTEAFSLPSITFPDSETCTSTQEAIQGRRSIKRTKLPPPSVNF